MEGLMTWMPLMGNPDRVLYLKLLPYGDWFPYWEFPIAAEIEANSTFESAPRVEE